MTTGFGFDSYENLKDCFFPQSNWWGGNYAVPEDFPTEDEILFAAYGSTGYDGYCLVVYRRDGKLYEVNGSHCSCYGLEGQWSPEETSKGALEMRKLDVYEYEKETVEFFTNLVTTL